MRHVRQWIMFVPEGTRSGDAYAKYLSFEMNCVPDLVRHFNAASESSAVSLPVYERIVQELLAGEGIDKLYGLKYDHNV